MATIVRTDQVHKQKTMHRPTEDPILEKWIHGTSMQEQLAFGELYKATSPYVFSILRRMLNSESLAEETLQEVFVSVWKKSRNYKPDAISPKSWIYNIARQHALVALRKREKNGNKKEPHGPPATASHLNSNRIKIQKDELDAGFGRLNNTTLEYITLAYCEGFSYEELSQITQHPANIIKSRVRRGLLTLKESPHEH